MDRCAREELMRAGGLAIVHRRTQTRGSHHIHQYAEDVRASILRKLGAYPRQKQLAAALREVGRLDRTLFTLDYLRDIELRRRIHAGLNKGWRETRARAVFFNRLGELRDRTYDNQQHRAGGLSAVVAAIVLWNTVYLEKAVQTMRDRSDVVDESLLAHLSPLGWEHINLTGD